MSSLALPGAFLAVEDMYREDDDDDDEVVDWLEGADDVVSRDAVEERGCTNA